MIKMFSYLTGIFEKEERKNWKILLVLNVISPATEVFNFSAVIYIINFVIDEQQVSEEILVFTFLMGMLPVFKGFFDLYKCSAYNRFIYDGAQRLSEKLFELLLREDLLHHNQRTPMQALALVRSDTQNCMKIMAFCIDIGVNLLTMAGYFAVMMCTSKWLGAASCIAFVLLMAGMFIYYREQIRVYGDKSRAYTIRTNAQVTIACGNFKEMKIADSSDVILRKYCSAGNEYAKVQKQFQYKKSIVNMVMQNFVMTALFMILGFFLLRPNENTDFFLASMVIYLTMLVKMIPMAYNIVNGLNDIRFLQKSYEELKEGMIRYSEITKEENSAQNRRHKKLTFKKGLFVDNLTFGYSGKKEIFKNASMSVPAGASVAVIGISGIGKTTFLDLILGLLAPGAGNILYDDYDIAVHRDGSGECNADLGDIVSYIPQTAYLNGETIRNNVAFFTREDQADEEKLTECLKCAQIWDDIMQMPKGVDTLIGENGTFLSGGQRQRIVLARALYKDFELLVMDEATAALDMETERAVIDSIRQVKKDKTILIATHHMSLADECDIVYRIENKGFVRVK